MWIRAMTFLGKRQEEWFLGHANQYIQGVNLSCPVPPRNGASLFRKSAHGMYFANFRDPSDIMFFLDIRFRNAKVHLEYWKADTFEPVFQCRLMGFDAYAAGYSNDEQIADGWVGVGSGEGATKWLHVDELEKIEGPPPEGAF